MVNQTKPDPYLVKLAKRVGLIMPFVILIYGLASLAELLPLQPFASNFAVMAISALFLLVGVYQYVTELNNLKTIKNILIIYHLLAAIFVIWVAGYTSPAVYFWLVLTIVSQLYFGRRGLLASVTGLAVTGLLAITADAQLASFNLTYYFVTFLVIAAIAWSIAEFQKLAQHEKQQLAHYRTQEYSQHSQLTSLINSLNIAVVTTSSTGAIRLYNAAFLNLLDTNQSLAGKPITETLQLEDADDKPFKQLLKTGGLQFERDDLLMRLTEGEKVNLMINCSPVHSRNKDKIEGYILVLRDITKEKSLDEQRDEFISVVSHELRTPVAIAEGTLSNLNLFLDKGIKKAKLKPALSEAHQQIVYLSDMINNLSTLSRAERGMGDDLEPIELNDFLTDLYHRYKPTAEEKDLQLDLDLSPKLGRLHTSRLYLEEILQNFLTNAIKYTAKGTVTLRARKTTQGVEFAVSDSGIGIAKNEQKQIFKRFYRSEDYRTRESSGTGLGLYVTKRLADKLSTEIKLTSRLNHGSTFSFVLTNQDK